MLICTKCQIEHEEGKKFCKNCGSPLSTKAESSLKFEEVRQSEAEKSQGVKICPKCQAHFEGGKYCRKCGSILVVQSSPEEKEVPRVEPFTPDIKSESPQVGATKEQLEEPGGKLFCPSCKITYESGKFCKKCGSILMEPPPFQAKQESLGVTPPGVKTKPPEGPPSEIKREPPEAELIERKSVKKLSKEWLTLSDEKKKLEILIKKLEAKRTGISSDMFNTTYGRYQAQLKSISSKCQKIQTDLESVKAKTSGEINLTANALKPFKKRLEEAQSLYKAAALTKTDFATERTELKQEIKLRENALRKHEQVISSLPNKMGGKVGAAGKLTNLLQPIPLIASGIIILIVVAGYFLWPKYSYLIKKQPQSGGLISKEGGVSSPISPAQTQPSTTSENQAQAVEKIKSLFENIRQANIQKNIDLFMSCYSLDFKDREEKKKSTLENWQNFDYFDLLYDLKSQAISGDTANAKVEWVIKFSPKKGGQAQETKSFLDVTLKKEEGVWKIKEIKPAS